MDIHNKARWAVGCSVAVALFAWTAPWLHADTLTQITIDTSAAAGQTDDLILDFDSGGGTQPNTFSVSNFYTDGTLSPIFQSHNSGVTGDLPGDLTFTNTNFVAELSVTMTVGNTITFDYQSTNNAPTAGAFPDEFDVYLLDNATFNSVLPTDDPSGAGSLVAIDLNGGLAPDATIFSGAVTVGPPADTSPVPEPANLAVVTSLVLLAGCRRFREWVLKLMLPTRGPASILALLLAAAPAVHAQTLTGVGVDPNVTLSFSGIRFNHANNTYVTVATLFNGSPTAIAGPFYVAITKITTQGVVTVANASASLENGNPAVLMPTPDNLSPGQTATVPIAFSDSSQNTFTIQGAVWDAASAPAPATLQCPQVTTYGTFTQDVTLEYTPPTDSVHRLATCTPAVGTNVTALGSVTVQCSTIGGATPGASCSSAPVVQFSGGTVTLPPLPAPTGIAIIPCQSMAGAFSPADTPLYLAVGDGESLPLPCITNPVGTAMFSIYNYGPYAATNFSVIMNFPPGPSQVAWQFSQAATCTGVPQDFTIQIDGVTETIPNGETVTCTFANLPPYQAFDAILGLNVSDNSLPAVAVSLALNSSENIPAPGMAPYLFGALLTMNPGVQQSITVPASISSENQGCNYSSSPGFAILLNTCGVPPVVTQVITGVVAGVATVLTGGAAAALDVTELSQSIIFSANQGASLILTR